MFLLLHCSLQTKQVRVSIDKNYIKENHCNKEEGQRVAARKNKSRRTMKKNKKEGY
jgi:hypothetical protein